MTTHRFVFVAQPLSQSQALLSFSAPFCALFDLSLEQPIFGANHIKGKVRSDVTNTAGQPSYTFKLKFNKGGAIEFGQAMEKAARRTSAATAGASGSNLTGPDSYNPPPPPPYAPPTGPVPAAASYYQPAPESVYQPGYNAGFALPTDVFSTPPPVGFVYAMDAPPPYPGLGPGSAAGPSGGYSVPSYPPAYSPPSSSSAIENNSAQAAAAELAVGNGHASAPSPVGPPAMGFVVDGPRAGLTPPSYENATKKSQ